MPRYRSKQKAAVSLKLQMILISQETLLLQQPQTLPLEFLHLLWLYKFPLPVRHLNTQFPGRLKKM